MSKFWDWFLYFMYAYTAALCLILLVALAGFFRVIFWQIATAPGG